MAAREREHMDVIPLEDPTVCRVVGRKVCRVPLNNVVMVDCCSCGSGEDGMGAASVDWAAVDGAIKGVVFAAGEGCVRGVSSRDVGVSICCPESCGDGDGNAKAEACSGDGCRPEDDANDAGVGDGVGRAIVLAAGVVLLPSWPDVVGKGDWTLLATG